MENYTLDALFASLELKEFNTVDFPVGLKEKVRSGLPSIDLELINGLVQEASEKYQRLMWEERVIVGYLTTIGAEELAKFDADAAFVVPTYEHIRKRDGKVITRGLDFVGIAAEGTEKRNVAIESEKFGSQCGPHSAFLDLKGRYAGYGVLEYSKNGVGFFEEVGEYAGNRSADVYIDVNKDAGSGFMAASKKGFGVVRGNVNGGSAGIGSENTNLAIGGHGGDLLLAESKESLATVVHIGNYACYKAYKPHLAVSEMAGLFLGEKMTAGQVRINGFDHYQDQAKFLGRGGSGTVTIVEEKSYKAVANGNSGFVLI